MARLNHTNVLRLLGYCNEYNPEQDSQEQIAVYDFMANGDLQRVLAQSKGMLNGVTFALVGHAD